MLTNTEIIQYLCIQYNSSYLYNNYITYSYYVYLHMHMNFCNQMCHLDENTLEYHSHLTW